MPSSSRNMCGLGSKLDAVPDTPPPSKTRPRRSRLRLGEAVDRYPDAPGLDCNKASALGSLPQRAYWRLKGFRSHEQRSHVPASERAAGWTRRWHRHPANIPAIGAELEDCRSAEQRGPHAAIIIGREAVGRRTPILDDGEHLSALKQRRCRVERGSTNMA